MASRNIKVTVTTLSGERVEVDVAPATTVQDIIAALVQADKLPAEDSSGNLIEYVLVNDATMVALAGDKPVQEQNVEDGAELRVKAGARVAAGS